MIGLLAQKGLSFFSRGAAQPSSDRGQYQDQEWGQDSGQDSDRARLLGLLDMLVDECDRDADLTGGLVEDTILLPDRYYSVARAAAQGHYRIEPERIAERLLRH